MEETDQKQDAESDDENEKITKEDKEFLINSINFLHSCGRIKKVKLIRKVFGFVKKLFVKKLSE